MKCFRCQHDNPPRSRFCLECGAALAVRCPGCHAELPPHAKFCNECGQPLIDGSVPTTSRFASPESYTPPHLAEKILSSRTALEGEHKQVTVLFADLVGSTGLAERVGAEAMHSLLNDFFEVALREVHRFEGTVNQFLGDGFMALFGAPIAHEDHARRAILAALGLQRAVRERPIASANDPLALRIGINTGPVVVGAIGDNLRMDYTAIGDTTNLAARLQQLADLDTILVGEATYRLVRETVRAEGLGSLDVKGKAAPVVAYRLLGLGPRRSAIAGRGERSLSPFVGRARELADLRELLVRVEGGHGHAVGIVGEPGLGKSRLLYEFRTTLAEPRLTYLEGRCLSYGTAIPYLPVLDIVRDNFGISDADTPETIAAKVHAGLEELGLDATEWHPYILQLLGLKDGTGRLSSMPPQAIKTQTFETLKRMAILGSRRRPLVLAVEDLHWIDRTSQEFLVELVGSIANSPVLLVATYRPGYHPQWLDRSYATQIALRPLAPEEDLDLLRSVLDEAALGPAAVRAITEKAEGNPFFIEELARVIAGRGGEGHSVPDTVQGVLMARIDRLEPAAKRLLQIASVVGREVPRFLLEALDEDRTALDGALSELTRLEFLYEEHRDEPVYVFKHVLTQEVAYESLLTPRREALHAAAGRALEGRYVGRTEQALDRLAFHFGRSADAVKAVEYLLRLGQRSVGSFAHAEAVSVLTDALAHVERLPAGDREGRHFEGLLSLGQALFFLGRRDELITRFRASEERLARLGDVSVACHLYRLLTLSYSFVGDRAQASASARRGLEAAMRAGDDAMVGQVQQVMAAELWFSGQTAEALRHGREAVARLERARDEPYLGIAYHVLAYGLAAAGDFDEALRFATCSEELGRRTGNRRVQCNAAETRAWVYGDRGEADLSIEAAEEGLTLAPDAFEAAIVRGALGYGYLVKGEAGRAVTILEQATDEANRVRSRQVQAWFRGLLGDAYVAAARLDRAETTLRDAFELSVSIEFPFGRALARRGLGRLAAARGQGSEARKHLEDALATFESIGARVEEGRTLLDLASVAHAAGEREVAAALVARARARFDELNVPRHVAHAQRLARQLETDPKGESG